MKKSLSGGILIALLCAGVHIAMAAPAQTAPDVEAPKFEVDTMWPKPLPNHWILGSVIGVSVDANDHIWIIHRGSATLNENEKLLESGNAECCAAAPPVLEFDQEGNLLRHWGGNGEGYEWPTGNHGIYVDYKGNVWLGGNGADDSQILKFTKDGKFLLQIGRKGSRRQTGAAAGHGEGAVANYAANSQDSANFGRVSKIIVDPATNEAYVSDGYLNKRIAVLDADTGRLKRYWGAYGVRPDDGPMPAYDPAAPLARQFGNPVHCVDMSIDRKVYVCDRSNDRLQVFTPRGKFLTEARYAEKTIKGTVWDIAFSKDPQQRFIYIADGANQNVKVVDRQSLKQLTQFGDGGRQPGAFYGVHSIATDSKGNIYTTETWEGKRVQRFLFKGVQPVPPVQGVPWPKPQ
jgi:DNA-binding beta-propeller fold protein YncE